MAQHNKLGAWGEALARDTLVAHGYAIVDMNPHVGHYELDIVAMKGDRLAFVEVKTRSRKDSDPTEAIDKKKIAYLCRAANAYVQSLGLPHEVQFDVITIVGSPEDPEAPEVEHYPDAFRPPLRSGH